MDRFDKFQMFCSQNVYTFVISRDNIFRIIGNSHCPVYHDDPIANDLPVTSNNHLGHRNMDTPLGAEIVNILVYDT